MRNIFDQYGQLENRLTHALVHVLDRNRGLLGDFVRLVTNSAIQLPRRTVLTCQQFPGASPSRELGEQSAAKERIPDVWICSEDRKSALLLECKLTAALTAGQLRGHVANREKAGIQGGQGVCTHP